VAPSLPQKHGPHGKADSSVGDGIDQLLLMAIDFVFAADGHRALSH
jgi:hypothetical protein